MTIRRAPQRTVAASTAAMLLLGTWSASALAAAGIVKPCPETDTPHVTHLHDMLTDDKVLETVADTESEPVEQEAETVIDGEQEHESPAKPEFTTRLPGVSANDMPRFRRHMFRTDI